MKRLTAIGAAAVLFGSLVALTVEHPPHHKAQAVMADATSPPATEAPTTTSTTIAPTTTVPPTTTPPTTPPTTVRTSVPTPPRPPVTRVSRSAPATAPAPPKEGDLTFPPECLSHSYWASFQQTSQKIGPAHACWDALLAQYSWDQRYAFSTLMCESEGDPNDVNSSSGATGLMQVITKGASTEPNQNMRQAWAKYTGAGNSWSPWNPSRSCASSHQKG